MRIAVVTPGSDFEFESVPGTDYIILVLENSTQNWLAERRGWDR
jgi:hypothetical protein